MAFSVGGSWYSASFGQLDPDTWYHLVGTYDGETLRAYRNGVLIEANTSPSGPADSEAAALTLGKQANGNGYFEGEVDEVRIYERALSDLEIFDLTQ